jgi:AraC-like DNA-binding protein
MPEALPAFAGSQGACPADAMGTLKGGRERSIHIYCCHTDLQRSLHEWEFTVFPRALNGAGCGCDIYNCYNGEMARSPGPCLVNVGRVAPNPAWGMPEHSHPWHETIVLLSGTLHVELGTERCVARTGDVLFYPRTVPHVERADPARPCELLYLAWTGAADGLPMVTRDRTGRLRSLLAWCREESREFNVTAASLRDSYLALFFQEYRRSVQLQQTADPLAQVALDYMTAHLSEPISLETLAAVAALSKHHFLRRYQRARGLTPTQELRRLRVEQARQLLITTALPIKEIPERVGLANEYHMSRLFRRLLGTTPGFYRRRGD